MSRAMEDRLKAAYQAKAEQVTDESLTRLRDERRAQLTSLLSEDADITRLDEGFLHPELGPGGRTVRHSRWFAPALAAAVVAAVAAGALAVANSHGPQLVRPAPPASHLSSPTSGPTPTPGASSSSVPTSQATPTKAAPPYLGHGLTGARADVPWSVVGTGWRLLQPFDANGPTSELYLYDPAGGRYLITDELPKQIYLQAWSPDGQRAMFRAASSGGDNTRFRQLDLSSGQLGAGFTQYLGLFLSYTRPRGLAVLVVGQVQRTDRLLRYGAGGTLQLAYPPIIAGQRLHAYYPILYTADGSQLVAQTGNYSVLLSNGGQLVQQYPLPDPGDQSCRPVKWWMSGVFLEACDRPGASGSYTALYLQPATGGTATSLVNQSSPIGMGYSNAWQLSNADILLARTSGCGSAGYDVLHPDGTVVPLRLPAGVPAPGAIINMSGDLATFRAVHGCGNPGTQVSLIDYNMVTGKTSTLLNSNGIMLGYPGND